MVPNLWEAYELIFLFGFFALCLCFLWVGRKGWRQPPLPQGTVLKAFSESFQEEPPCLLPPQQLGLWITASFLILWSFLLILFVSVFVLPKNDPAATSSLSSQGLALLGSSCFFILLGLFFSSRTLAPPHRGSL